MHISQAPPPHTEGSHPEVFYTFPATLDDKSLMLAVPTIAQSQPGRVFLRKSKCMLPLAHKKRLYYSAFPYRTRLDALIRHASDGVAVAPAYAACTLTIDGLGDVLGKRLIWWAAKPGLSLPNEADAYDEYQNSGVVVASQENAMRIVLHSPSRYLRTNGKTLNPWHVHFAMWDAENGVLHSTIWTLTWQVTSLSMPQSPPTVSPAVVVSVGTIALVLCIVVALRVRPVRGCRTLFTL